MAIVATLTRYWWLVLIRGIAALLFGIMAFAWPAITLAVLVLLFGAYAIIDGIFALVAGMRASNQPHRAATIIEGLISVAAGVIAFVWPAITALALLYIIAFWAIVTGVLEIVAALQWRRVMTNEWLLALSGILSIIFGALLAARPLAGALAVIWIIAAYAVIFGILLIGFAFRLRGLGRPSSTPTAGSATS